MLWISAVYAGMRCLSVCPSVCLSVTFVSCAKTNIDIFEIFSPSGNQAVLVFHTKRGGASSNHAILNDLEGLQTQISWSDYSLTLNMSKMAADTAIVTMEANRKPYPSFQMVPLSMTLSDL